MSFSNNKLQWDFYPDRGLNELERDFKNINHKNLILQITRTSEK